MRCAGRELDDLDDLEDIAHRLVPLLAVLLGAQEGQLFEMRFEQRFHTEQHLDSFGDRRAAPGRISLGGGLDSLFNLFGRALRRERDHRARRRVVAGHNFFAARVFEDASCRVP